MDKNTTRVAAVAAALIALLPLAGTASADDIQKDFYTNAPAFSASDARGTFTGQVDYRAPDFPMAWSFDIAPAVESIAVSPMDCTAGLVQPDPPYSDRHTGIPVTYLWHSTVRATPLERHTDLWGHCRFNVNVGGRPGVADLKFTFDYTIHNRPIGQQGAEQDPPFNSTLDIQYTA
ncbi:hypothetical protein [Saccharopolyspora taberi]|uniref:Uncharacterized protein n=1 Tax=Saccharopolyspora taberi TaxID=60895 RepID=A0ABN3VD58_9PSEU